MNFLPLTWEFFFRYRIRNMRIISALFYYSSRIRPSLIEKKSNCFRCRLKTTFSHLFIFSEIEIVFGSQQIFPMRSILPIERERCLCLLDRIEGRCKCKHCIFYLLLFYLSVWFQVEVCKWNFEKLAYSRLRYEKLADLWQFWFWFFKIFAKTGWTTGQWPSSWSDFFFFFFFLLKSILKVKNYQKLELPRWIFFIVTNCIC